MDRNASTIFRNLFEAGSKAFKLIRETAVAPEKTKKLKEWGISEVAEMVNRTSQTLRNLEDSGKIPKARQAQHGKRVDRIYSLKEINHLRDLLGTRPKKPAGSETAILGFVNFKGGAGKTTSAIGAAQYFAQKGYRVLFIDCDSQASATQMFGYIPDEDFEDTDTILNILIDTEKNMSSMIKKTYWDGLDLIPANLSLYNAELIIPTQIGKMGNQLAFYNRLNTGLKMIADEYDIIILDCPPSMGMISINAIFAANALVIEMPPVIVDFASTIQFFKMVSEVMDRLPKKTYSFIRILITKYNGRTTAKQLQDLLRGFFGQYLMSNNMIESEAISKAASNMQTLYEIDKFDGDKRTYERAIQQSNNVNEELESLIQVMWTKAAHVPSREILEMEIVK
jgi:chromosome partitioning protein